MEEEEPMREMKQEREASVVDITLFPPEMHKDMEKQCLDAQGKSLTLGQLETSCLENMVEALGLLTEDMSRDRMIIEVYYDLKIKGLDRELEMIIQQGAEVQNEEENPNVRELTSFRRG